MKKTDFNSGWYFRKAESKTWEQVNLPHDAMIHEERDPNCKNGRNTGYYPGGSYEYRKCFTPAPELSGKKLLLELEGAYQEAHVFLNGEELAFQPYGYVNFFADLTQHLRYGEDNEILVTTTTREPSCRWYSGSGIYRPVWLHVGERFGITEENIRIRTVSYDPAVLNITTFLPENEAGALTVLTEIMDGEKLIAAAEGADVSLTISDPKYWSADSPNLYRCRVTVADPVSGKKDSVCVAAGICHIAYSTEGLFINGNRTLLRGACFHHDNGIIGAAEFPEAARRRVRILKEAGFNAIRSAHNPISKALLAACDEIGMYIMDEFTDMWYDHKLRYDYACWFEQMHTQDLTAMVRKDDAHPSVILYSIGNEITETAEPLGIQLTREMADTVRKLDDSRPVTAGINMSLNVMHFAGMGVYQPEPDEQPRIPQKKNPKALAILGEMAKQKEAVRAAMERQKNAPSDFGQAGGQALGVDAGTGSKQGDRLVGSEYFNQAMITMKERQRAIVSQEIARILSEDAYSALDICGYNYADGRYEADRRDYPNRVSVGSETLPQRIAENCRLMEKCPYIIGDFIWTGWDYIGEAAVGTFCYDSVGSKDKSYPALLAGSGIIDLTGNPRPEVGFSKTAYRLEKGPFMGIEPLTHARENRLISPWRYSDAVRSYSWHGYEGVKSEAVIYADAAGVELFINGKSVGKAEITNNKAVIPFVYEPGEAVCVAYDESGAEIGRDRLVTAGEDTCLSVQAEKTRLSADGQDLLYLNIAITDRQGIVKASEDRKIKVEVCGEGTLLGFGSADPYDTEGYCGDLHSTYYGRCQAIIRTNTVPGEIAVRVSSQGLEDRVVTVESFA